MRKLVLVSLVMVAFLLNGCKSSESETKLEARRASVQIVFNIPVLKATFTEPLKKEEDFNKDYITEILEKKDKEIEKKIKEAIEEDKKLRDTNRFEAFPTTLDEWYKPISKTMIPLFAVIKRDDIKLLDKIIIACKTDKKDISEIDKKYEKDILTISEVANVSPTTAKDIISKLRTSGYSINKEELSKSSDIKLLWFKYGWGSAPSELDWYVKVEGTDNNIIINYQNGIIETQPIPDDKIVHVYAQYFDLKPEFMEKSTKVKELESEIESMKKEREELKNTIKEKDKELNKDKKIEKRDISHATLFDVMTGVVKLDEMWMLGHGTGVYLGNFKAREGFGGFTVPPMAHVTEYENAGLILTNAHVAQMALSFQVYVSKDKEVMWVVFPGIPSVRHTTNSDNYGSPANVLFVNYSPVLSWDYDCALMITTPIKSMEKNYAVLGNSDNVKEGDKIISVGNPGELQKFTTAGVVANTSFSILDSIYSAVFLEEIKSKPAFNWIKNSRFWFDAPIGIGGTSGSGVWATSGSEAGKVIALHNMGLVQSYLSMSSTTESKEIRLYNTENSLMRLSDYLKTNKDKIIDSSQIGKLAYTVSRDKFESENKDLFDNFKREYSIHVPLSGLNGGIPINSVKMYLEEMGINYKDYNWEPLDNKHWEQ